MEKVTSILKIVDLVLGFRTPLHSGKLNVAIPSRKFTALLGKNGSGKSTLLSALCGGEGRLSGNIYVDGSEKPTHQLSPKSIAQSIAYVPQEHQYPAHFRVVDLLAMAFFQKAGVWGRMPGAKDPIIQDIAEKLSLTHLLDKHLGKMSSGERQRVFLARAILQKPKILILDEPTNHLDPSGVGEFWAVLSHICKTEGLSVLMSTHDLSFVERYAEEILALGEKGVVFQGTRETYLNEKIVSQIFPGVYGSTQA